MWTPQEKAQCVAWFIESKSDTQVQRNFQTKFKRYPPSRPTIRAWHTSFMTTGSVLHKKGAGRPRTSDETVERVREAFLRNPKKSVRSAAGQLQIPRSTVHMVLHKRLHLYAYKEKMSSEHYVVLNTGQKMPLVGLGTWKSEAGQVKEAIKYALGIGYRHIDCATAYSNEGEIGDCLQELVGADKPVKREELFVTSKLWNTKHHPEDVEPALKKTLQDLKLDYLDLYLMHWPHAFERGDNLFPKNPDGTMRYDYTDYKETWKAMEKLVTKGLVKAIGLSNFNSRQIDDIIGIAYVKPAVLQVECHPYLAQNELIVHCQEQGLEVTAYSPLGSPDRMWKHPDEPVLLEEPGIKKLAEKYNKSPAQILLRWQVQRKVVVIPKSVTPARIQQNIQVFDFSLSSDEMTYIGNLNKNWRYIVPMITIEGKLVARDAGHPFYPFNEPH